MAQVISRKSIIYDILLNTKQQKKATQQAAQNVKKVDKETNQLNKSLKNLGVAFAAAFGTQQLIAFTIEATKLAAAAQGIERAFKRIGDQKLLKDLRDATQGTVQDLELMKQAIRARNFDIPLKQMANLFGFAARRARETGESVDFLVNSIVAGIGRKSPLILDNLGISAVRLRKELKGVGIESANVADIATIVSRIATEEMDKMGKAVDDAAVRLDQVNVRLQDIKLTVGQIALAGLDEVFLKSFTNLDKNIDTMKEASEIAQIYDKNLEDIIETQGGWVRSTIALTDEIQEFIKELDLTDEQLRQVNESNIATANLFERLANPGGGLVETTITVKDLQDELVRLKKELLLSDVDDLVGIRALQTEIKLLEDRIKSLLIPLEAEADAIAVVRKETDLLTISTFKLSEATQKLVDALILKSELLPVQEIQVGADVEEAVAKEKLKEATVELGESLLTASAQGLEAAGVNRVATAIAVIANQAKALSTGIAAAVEAGSGTGPAAAFVIISSIAAIVGAITAAFAGIQSFAEGTEFLEGDNKGIPIIAHKGEAIIPEKKNAQEPGLAKSWIAGNIDEYIQQYYINPALQELAFTENKDIVFPRDKYGQKQWLNGNEANFTSKKMVGLLNRIEQNTKQTKVRGYRP